MKAIVTPADITAEVASSTTALPQLSIHVPVNTQTEPLPKPGNDKLNPTKSNHFPPPEDPLSRKLKRLDAFLDEVVADKETRDVLRAAARATPSTIRRTKSEMNLGRVDSMKSSPRLLRRTKSSSALRWETWSYYRELLESRELLTPHSDILAKEDMPFSQKPFVYSKHGGKWGGFFDSLMLPYYGSMLSVAGSTYFVFSNLFEKAMIDMLKKNPETIEISTVIVVACCCVGPLFLAMMIMSALHEYPCRVLIYHRLWEHKIVINFKQRNFTHKRTRSKIFGIAGIAAFYLAYGWFGLEATFSFLFVFIQGFATIAWVVYSTINPDKTLVPVARALRHYSNAHKPVESTHSQKKVRDLSGFCVQKLTQGTSGVLLVSESDIKHDIIALVKRSREQDKLLEKAPKSPLSFEKWRVIEEYSWVVRLATWTGRLGHTKETLGSKLKGEDRDTYARSFFEVYNDGLWHRYGSFAREANSTEATRLWHSRSEQLCRLAVIVIELLGGARVGMVVRGYQSTK